MSLGHVFAALVHGEPRLGRRIGRVRAPENQSCEVISLLEQHLASLPQPARPDLAPKQIRTLNRQLKNLKFSQLVYLCPCSQLTHIQEAMSSLREQRAVEDLSMYEGYFSL